MTGQRLQLFLISQEQNGDYDVFDSAVVAAYDAETARNMNPRDGNAMDWDGASDEWCRSVSDVSVRFLGNAHDDVEPGVICSSFNAG